MTRNAQAYTRPWWKLGRLEQVALALGAAVGLVAAAPLVWLSAEAQRTGHSELTAAADLRPVELLLVWLLGAATGGLLAAHLARRLMPLKSTMPGHVMRLAGGILTITLLSPLPLAAVILLATRRPEMFGLYYVSSGGLIGWQPGVISFVFLYTFRVLEQRNRDREGKADASQSR